MDIAQISEIYLNDPAIATETAPSSVVIDQYRGLSGDRGSYIIPGLGNPNTYDFTNAYILNANGVPEYIAPNPFDLFINLQTTDPGYMTVYQLDNTGTVWNRVFKSIPNIYNTNFVANFVDGVYEATITVPRETMILEQLFGDYTNTTSFDVFRIPVAEDTLDNVNSEAEMLDLLSVSGNYAFRIDLSQLFRLKDEDPSLLASWQSELSINIDIDIETPITEMPYPNACGSNVFASPTADDDNYYFFVNISLSELTESGFVAVNGERIVHASISVI